MTLDRYVIRLVAIPTFAGFALLTLLVTAYNAALLLRDAAYARIPAEHVVALILLRNVTAAEVLLPTSMYIAVLATINQWHREREAFACYAAGIAPDRIGRAVGLLCLAVCIAVAGLSLFARPWAYGESYRIDRAASQLGAAAMVPDRFYTFGDGVVLSAHTIESSAELMRGVFLQSRGNEAVRVILAESGRIEGANAHARRRLELMDGTAYWIAETSLADRVSTFARLVYYAPDQSGAGVGNPRRATATSALLDATRPKEIAELQWRLVLPVIAFFLTLTAMEIGRAMPGTSPYPRFVLGLVVYAAMFNLAAVARTWLENGLVDPVPGMLWVPLLAVALWLVLRRLPQLSLSRPR